MKPGRIFAPAGLLALAPHAFGMVFETANPNATAALTGGVAVVSIRGPLMHHATWWGDSYDAIKQRVAIALEARPKAVLLAIDSPGGLVNGCFETSQELRAMCAAANVPLHAYVDGQATSAGYALACAASRISAPRTAMVGSIGVLDALVDATKQDAMYGVSFELVTSGARKADGNPHVAVTAEAKASRQAIVDELANHFFEVVAEARGMKPEAVKALEAEVFTGSRAKSVGLVDAVGTMDDALAVASGNGGNVAEDNKDEKTSSYKDAVAALRKAAESDDDEGKAAKKMLAAIDDEEDSEEDEGDKKPAAESKESDSGDDKSAKAIAGEALRVARVSALLADRPDLSSDQKKAFRKLDPGALEAVLAVTPRVAAPNPVADIQVKPTIGKTQGTEQVQASSDPQIAAMDRVMGFGPKPAAIRRDGNDMVFSATVTREEAAAVLKNGVAR